MGEVRIISAPFHAGALNVRVGAGPGRLLADGLEQGLHSAGLATSLVIIAPVDDFEGEIGRSFEIKRRIAAAVAEARADGAFPVVLAGNCNAEVGTWSGLGDEDAGLIWFDAHPDFDTPDEHRSGYLDGMGLATLAGQCWRNLAATIPGFRPFDVARLVYCGIRDFGPGQWEKVEAAGIRAAVGSVESETDYAPLFEAALEDPPFERASIHLDVDCLDTSVGIANEYAAPGGLGVAELHACLAIACAAAQPLSLTIASFNPNLEGAERISAAAIDAAISVATAAARPSDPASTGGPFRADAREGRSG
ncbi:MAG TPA: arginase family protein [Allosphingosinicella sp.]|nr:arginase family protein [Allosphingosinicella sp.]